MTTQACNVYHARLQMRPDLICRRQWSGSQQTWVVKDPISLRYFSLSSQEFAILEWLDGSKSLDDIRREFEAAFPPQRITPQHLQSFFADLYANGLIIADAPQQGHILLENLKRQQKQERWQAWLNWLAIRIPIFDPDRLLAWFVPKLSWLFSRTYLLAFTLLAIVAIGFVAFHFAEFHAQLPELKELMSPRNLVSIVLAFVAVKVLHEFGHALTCKRFGGECHELGVMLLLFVPCLYCNVTDSWILPSSWRRIAVSAAGMFVEFQLATLAVFIWWFSVPSVVHAIALNTMVVCTVGTLFFNGNPLLRYDGYFILADLLGIPNLWQESRLALKTELARAFLRTDFAPHSDPPERRTVLITYAMASIVYRIFVMLAIVLFLQRVLIPKGLGVLIPIVAATFVLSAGVFWLFALRRFWSKPMAWQQFRIRRVLFASAAAATSGWLLFTVPLPCRVSAPALLQPVAAQRVYVSTPGALRECVAPGTSVVVHQPIAQLDDVKLHRDIVRLTGELNVVLSRVQSLKARLNEEPDSAAQLEVAQEMLADVEHRLQQRAKDERALTLTAPISGVVMEPSEVPQVLSSDQKLPTWYGTPLEAKNLQCFLERGTVVCLVGDPASQEAVLFIDENEVRYVRPGQQVRMKFAIAPMEVLSGKIIEVAKRNTQVVPRELAVDQDLPNRTDTTGLRRPISTSYSVRVVLDKNKSVSLLSAARGQAKILVEPQSLAERLLRNIRRTFTLNL